MCSDYYMNTLRSVLFLFTKNAMHMCPFWSSSALGISSESPSASLNCIHHKVQQANGCCHQTVMQSSGCFLTLNQMNRLFAHQFHRLYFLHVARDASKMKLVTLSGRSLTVTQGKWESDPENTAVCICVFCHFLTYTPTQRKQLFFCVL